MNKCIFIGNLAADPESKVISNGKKACQIRLAVQRSYVNAQGVREADFLNLTAYDKTAENAERHLRKGRKIAAICHVKVSSYDKDGTRQYRTDFIVEHIEFLSSAQQDGAAASQSAAPAAQGYNGGFTEVDDEELPF